MRYIAARAAVVSVVTTLLAISGLGFHARWLAVQIPGVSDVQRSPGSLALAPASQRVIEADLRVARARAALSRFARPAEVVVGR